MEREERNQRLCKPPKPDFFLQWGNKKRLRCVRVRDPQISQPFTGRIRRKIASEKETSLLQPTRCTRNSEASTLRSENRKSGSASPEKGSGDGGERGIGYENRGLVWPKLYITLSSKEKEEDFMAMKGCKPPQRPKKRAKVIQRTLLLVSPGAWLSDMCQERYEVREKKSSKKRPRGLKAMGSMESDSE
ncbi:uncharacterized protein LOC130791605 [Actinidia eriantha]|uniref:uncharacterized protein LOC130791605 n=1 Tax=Actinidia eriantha TaxID=165200 RepID=UPI0025841E19|nr:uncharacterized protein LOC130791605 [Actinidia eriantha]